MKGNLTYYHKHPSKNPTEHYCEIENDEFIVYETTERKKVKKKILLDKCIKFSVYIDDHSWELCDHNNSYRFIADDKIVNDMWRKFIEEKLTPKPKNNSDDDAEDLYKISFNTEKIQKNLVDKLKLSDPFTLEILDDGLNMKNILDANHAYMLDYKNIRKYGTTKYNLLVISLGTKNSFGPADLYISFDSDKTNSIVADKIQRRYEKSIRSEESQDQSIQRISSNSSLNSLNSLNSVLPPLPTAPKPSKYQRYQKNPSNYDLLLHTPERIIQHRKLMQKECENYETFTYID